MTLRDIPGDYKAAYLSQYAAYMAAGRVEDAADAAKALKDEHGYDVDADDTGEGTPEQKSADTLPEKAVPPKPARAKRAPAKKPAEG